MKKEQKQFEVKITGSGTRQEIVNSIYNLLKYIQSEKRIKGSTVAPFYEDPTLCMEIDELSAEEIAYINQ